MFFIATSCDPFKRFSCRFICVFVRSDSAYAELSSSVPRLTDVDRVCLRFSSDALPRSSHVLHGRPLSLQGPCLWTLLLQESCKHRGIKLSGRPQRRMYEMRFLHTPLRIPQAFSPATAVAAAADDDSHNKSHVNTMVLFIFVRKMPFSCNTSFSILCICLQKAHLFCSQYFHLQVYVALIWLRSVPHVFEQRHTHTYHQWPWAAAVEGCYWHYSFAICNANPCIFLKKNLYLRRSKLFCVISANCHLWQSFRRMM